LPRWRRRARIRIGTLVCGKPTGEPAVLAKTAAGVDIISGGRFVLARRRLAG
jgi:alkanesulfonate monooxygenase SsuD/methylene tetrahydromethanopterin reductase-like flavin-dependent oxidoreductase (luciferase family)